MTRVLRAGRWVLTRVTLGTFPQMSLAEAREAAERARETAQGGGDPGRPGKETRVAMEVASRNTFAAVRADFMERHLRRGNRPLATATRQQRLWILAGADFREWEDRPVTSITRADVRRVLDTIMGRGSPSKANATLAHLRVLFRWALTEELIDEDPTAGVRRPGVSTSRDRVLSLEEIRLLWAATADGEPFSDLVRVLLLTGCRRAEWGGAMWSEFEDLSGIGECLVLSAARTKSGRPHIVPLCDPVMTILSRRQTSAVGRSVFGIDKGFTRWSASKALLDARLNLAPWRVHDLRRSFVTHLHEQLHIPPHIVEACVGHQGVYQSGVAGIYNRSSYLPERKAALDAWGAFVVALVGEGESSNVVPFTARPPA
jgi:integrase